MLEGEDRARQWERAIAAVGMGDSGEPGSTSEEHDRHLADAYAE